MKPQTETEVVTVGNWSERKFDGLLLNGNYVSKGDARRGDELERREYWRARRAFRNSSYSLEDAPLKSYTDGKLHVWHHNLKTSDI